MPTRARTTLSVVIFALLVLPAAASEADPRKPNKNRPVQTTSKVDLAAFQARVSSAAAKAGPAVVRIAFGKQECWGQSGVIMTPDGYILSCGLQHPHAGSEVAVYLADGRRVTARMLGWSWAWDIGALKITQKGPWPHVEPGTSKNLRPDDPCLALGYPTLWTEKGSPSDRRPSPRLGRVTASALPWWFASSCQRDIRDWGGGLFDLDGRLIGTISLNGRHPTIDTIQKTWTKLVSGEYAGLLSTHEATREVAGSRETISSRSADLAHDVDDLLDRIVAASIGIGSGSDGKTSFSGVIISEDGYIATCSHHGVPFGKTRTVFLSDGRTVPAKVLGRNPLSDVGLMKIMEKGPWPHVDVGSSVRAKHGDLCISVGYPTLFPNAIVRFDRRHPSIRIGYIVDQPPDDGNLETESIWTTCDTRPGDSGGGLFDMKGRLLGLVTSSNLYGVPRRQCSQYRRIELLDQQRDFLAGNTPVRSPSAAAADPIEESFRSLADAARPSVVEVRAGGKRQALGTVVDSDGWILTKASALHGDSSCRLPDGRDVPAVVQAVSHQDDVALLKVDARDIQPVMWSSDDDIPLGTLLAAVDPAKERPVVGLAYHPLRAVSRCPAELVLGNIQDAEGGVAIRDVGDAKKLPSLWPDYPFREGDVVTQIAGRPTPDTGVFRKLAEQLRGDKPFAVAGDRVVVEVRRRGKELNLPFLLPSRRAGRVRQLPRTSGFPAVIDAALTLSPDGCGGPVVDGKGRVVGVVVGYESRDKCAWVLPAGRARRIVAELEGRR